jgi:ethanolamine ammonia-lyase small subunit
MIDRSKIEAMVRAALDRTAGGSARPVDSGGGVMLRPDRGVNLGEPYDPESMAVILEATPARVAVGRAGTRYRTNTLLRFRADHAAAKDAVLSEVDEKLVEKLGFLALRTRAQSKMEFLQRPDRGRALDDESRARAAERLPRGADLIVVYGDGLSAAAINTNMEAFHRALVPALEARGVRLGGTCFVRYSRVKVMDEICRIAESAACAFVCGERPGLGFSDSLSAYFIYRPPSGVPTDADREVISNINPRGLDVGKGAAALAEACERILREKKSGVVF